MALTNLHICTGSSEPSLCHTAISTKIKCACQTGHAFMITIGRGMTVAIMWTELL